MHRGAERLAPLLEVGELVERGAGRRQQDDGVLAAGPGVVERGSDSAVRAAFDDARASGEDAIVLLSPACASFDQFADFEERGEAFRTAVHDLTVPAGREVRA